MNRCTASRPARERGAALLTVLVLTASMSALAVSILDDLLFAVRRTANVRVAEQAVWHALGAEALGVAAIRRSLERQAGRASRRSLWARGEQRFPIEGGMIAGRVRDGGNCFNLNSLVRPEGAGRRRRNPESAQRFRRLLEAVEVDRARAEAIADAVVDWLDDDGRPAPRGAEDHTYAGRPVPYRAPGAALAEVSELRAVDGVDAALYHRLAPLVCAHPTHDPSRINVNTLTEAQAPLLTMLLGPDLGRREAREVILDRPGGGYATLEGFWAHPALEEIEPSAAARRDLAFATRYYDVVVEVRYRGHRLVLTSLFRREGAASLTRLRRRLERPA